MEKMLIVCGILSTRITRAVRPSQ